MTQNCWEHENCPGIGKGALNGLKQLYIFMHSLHWAQNKGNNKITEPRAILQIKVIKKLPDYEQSYKGKVKTHNFINRQNQSTTGKL